ncbi:MAG: DUF1192 domain-containing protein [Alphaproteobacteria bacterium]|nr:MAG: DUF1192 domain-containing protein [Alphaproteobacteria bacterium]
MDWDDLTPKPKPAITLPRVLEGLSVEELRAYIPQLEAEIERVRATIEQRQGQRSQAEAFFAKIEK